MPGFAWEYLRRHSEYQETYTASLQRGRDNTEDLAAPWGLLLLENPAVSAEDALVFWRTDAQPGALHVQPRPDDNGRTMDLWTESGRKAIAVTQAGLVLLIERDGKSFRLMLENPGALDDRMAFDLRIGALPESLAQMEAARAFLKTFLAERQRRQIIHPSAHRHAHYLQALDGDLAGASYLEIAAAIYAGSPLLDTADGRRTLTGRARYAVQRAYELMNGGYLSLLLSRDI